MSPSQFFLALWILGTGTGDIVLCKPFSTLSKRKALLLQDPDLFEGDIEVDKRNAVAEDWQLWADGKIPYEIDPEEEDYRDLFQEAFAHFAKYTCIRFVPRTDEMDYVRIVNGIGCSSRWGRRGGEQLVHLAAGCHDLGTVVHELNHAVGFNHEHNRSDRDDYIRILWENIQPRHLRQFVKLQPYENRLLTKFDYDSVMLYGSSAFSKSPDLHTMEATKPGRELFEVFEKPGLSLLDVTRINMLYHCDISGLPKPPKRSKNRHHWNFGLSNLLDFLKLTRDRIWRHFFGNLGIGVPLI